ncbi:MAG: hypothetical protein EA380_10330 [Phycisphaeraceae bacterium]|nr:MAG: hypothetical protein EA380_10330 [Phycisphaeraceae bacterium]
MSTEREPPAERFAVDSMTLDFRSELAALRAETTPAAHGRRQKTLFKHAGRTIALFVMDAGAALQEHDAAGTVTIQPVEGELIATVQGKEQRLRTGQILVLQPRVRHSIRADAPSAFLLQISLEHDTTTG